ncbi:MAG: tRNA glutamyl-Q(34) synthetase GluQRS [Actinobacteria bacterium]|nr:tRNA glutamyl-Q(34) synthetase GluQRS [Actinomycetota bacterium]
MAGRFAPSPTSDLHLGNLRTALLAWLFARSTGRELLVRIEDLDQVRVAAASGLATRQLADLAALGIDHDGPVVRQSQRLDLYAEALAALDTYECYCSRREILESAQAPHDEHHRPYPGTCRDLTEAERAARRAVRPAALRVRAGGVTATGIDELYGPVSGAVDDFVVRRGDGTYAYNLAVVVDDGLQGVDQVVRGDDLLSSVPRQAWLAGQLGFAPPTYAHVPLAVGPDGRRLAKRDGAVTLSDLAAAGVTAEQVLARIAASLDLAEERESVSTAILLERFDPANLPRQPWVVA